jgi:hypothetical protein
MWPIFWIALTAATAQPRVPALINGDVPGLAAPPAFAVHPGGRVTFAWSVYEHGQERMVSNVLETRGVSRPTELSPGSGLHSTPVMVATGPRSGWVFWMRQAEGRWLIVGRELRDNLWLPMVVLAGERGHALFPAAAVSGNSVTLAWEEHSTDPQRIASRRWDGRAWSAAEWTSGDRLPAYRPVVAGTRSTRGACGLRPARSRRFPRPGPTA